MSELEKLRAAVDLMQIGAYDQAADLLATIDHPTARRWLHLIGDRPPLAALPRTPAAPAPAADADPDEPLNLADTVDV